MLTLDNRAIVDIKIQMLNDLEKRIKTEYKSQFSNIAIKIISIPKRYKKRKAAINLSEDIQKIDNIGLNIYNYLMDVFDVFGDNAVLNAKRIFEDNAAKWGSRLYRRYNKHYTIEDLNEILKDFYISFGNEDLLTLIDGRLHWHFMEKEYDEDPCQRSNRYFSVLYDLKILWMQEFTRSIMPNYMTILEIIKGNKNITINIVVKNQ